MSRFAPLIVYAAKPGLVREPERLATGEWAPILKIPGGAGWWAGETIIKENHERHCPDARH